MQQRCKDRKNAIFIKNTYTVFSHSNKTSGSRNPFDLKDVRNEGEREPDNLVKRTQTEAKTSNDHILAERDGALPRYHGVLGSVRGVGKAADERIASHTKTTTG